MLTPVLAGCALAGPLENASVTTIERRVGLETMASCLVEQMNFAFAEGFVGAPKVRHAINVKKPGNVYEVHPQQLSTGWGSPYVVRLTRSGDGMTAELFARYPYAEKLKPAVHSC